MKGIEINGVHTFRDLGFVIAKRNISIPIPNKIKESVPYQNGEYDFSCINGEMTYQNRILSYTFDIAELTTEEMEIEKRKILNWACNVVNERIFDDYLPNFYFIGSYESSSWSEDFGQGELTLEFSVYPYCFEIKPTIKTFEIDGETTLNIMTESSHKIIPTITSTGNLIINRDTDSIAIAPGSFKDVDFYLDKENYFVITGTGTITFEYVNEVL